MKTMMTLTAAIFLSFTIAVAQQNPVLLGPIDPGTDSIYHGWMSRDVANGHMYFKMYDGTGSEIHPANPTARVGCLWRTDGTPPGTSRYAVAQVTGEVRAIGNYVYFGGADADLSNADDPWRSDGTVNGTLRLIDLGKRVELSSTEWDFEELSGSVYFKHAYRKNWNQSPVFNLMHTDGTVSGTGVLSPISGGMMDLITAGSNLYITLHTSDLWISDGTSNGTVLLKDICPGSGGCSVEPYTPMPRPYSDTYYSRPHIMNGVYYARFADGTNGDELWKSDGTAAGTVMVKDINSGSGSSWPCMFAEMDGVLYFAAYDATNGYELWRSDGTTAGTALVKDINPTGNSEPLWITAVSSTAGDYLLFSADDGVNGRELWISDGTTAGTAMLKDINASGSSNPRFTTFANREYRCSDEDYMNIMTSYNGVAYFAAEDGSGYELWRSDGTASGTYKLVDIHPNGGSNPLFVTEVNGKILFFAYEPGTGNEWYSYDPTKPVNLVQNTPPVASFIATPGNGTAPLQVAFDGSASYDPDQGGSIVSYEWDFGDGNTATGVTTSHTYQLAGTYTAILTVTDDAYATDDASMQITVSSSGSADIFVDQQSVTRITLPGNRYAGQSTMIVKDNANVVEGAVVYASYSGPTSGTVSGTTNAAGSVTLETAATKKDLNNDWCFTVTDIQKAGYTFTDQAGEPHACEGSPKRSIQQPASCVLHAPYPNPFGSGSLSGGSATQLRFDLTEPSHVSLRVYDALGRLVSTLADEQRSAGSHTVRFDAGVLPSGTYFVRFSASNAVQSMRIVLQR